MTTSAISNNTANTFLNSQVSDASTTTVKKDPLGKQAFLTMMVAQLKNQNPLNPMDGTAFTAQLAQFSSLEQQINMNTSLTSILSALKTSSSGKDIFEYIGKNISSDGNPVTLTGGAVASGGSFTLTEPAKINVVVSDSNGKAIRTMGSGTKQVAAGTYDIGWDGKDDSGNTVADGTYTYKVTTLNSNNEYGTASTSTSGLVSGITSSNGMNYLVVNGKNVDPSSVETVTVPTTTK